MAQRPNGAQQVREETLARVRGQSAAEAREVEVRLEGHQGEVERDVARAIVLAGEVPNQLARPGVKLRLFDSELKRAAASDVRLAYGVQYECSLQTFKQLIYSVRDVRSSKRSRRNR
eukprot:1987426-Pleurochrysis_carterae.AAC.3